jgi:hypothetical protein
MRVLVREGYSACYDALKSPPLVSARVSPMTSECNMMPSSRTYRRRDSESIREGKMGRVRLFQRLGARALPSVHDRGPAQAPLRYRCPPPEEKIPFLGWRWSRRC